LILTVDPRMLPGVEENRLYLDYISGRASARSFYEHGPLDFPEALTARWAYPFPRAEVAALLYSYNASLGADAQTLAHVEALAESNTFCVITGQQAGFMGGPAYTAIKIATAIRLARCLEVELGIKAIPMFWLATEDHDFDEINHTYYMRADGEVGRVRFDWSGAGQPISRLPVSESVLDAYQTYIRALPAGPNLDQVIAWFGPDGERNYGEWQARTWLKVFAGQGLVIVEPRVLRPAGGAFFQRALRGANEIAHRLTDVAEHLDAAGYAALLTSEDAGQLYTFDDDGRRIRVDAPKEHIGRAIEMPDRYSTDAALRPLFADVLLPVLVSVLGPGEIAYQGMLKPLYELLGIPQPILMPRKSYTVVSASDVECLERYGLTVEDLLAPDLDLDAAFRNAVPASELALFARARQGLGDALSPLRPYLEGIDPSLDRTWSQTLYNATRALSKLEERALKARMSQLGMSKRELRALRNVVLPRGRPQERVLPLPHFVSRFGPGFVQTLLSAGGLGEFRHQILIIEEDHA